MAKPAWGIKHICHSCGIRFYDLLRDPIICPSCGVRLKPEVLLKASYSRVTNERKQPVKQAHLRTTHAEAAEEEAEVVQEEPAEESEGTLDEDEAAEDENEKNVFVHISAVERSGLGSLHEGQKLSYELQRDQRSGKTSAANLQAA